MDKLKERLGLEVESLADELFTVSDFLLENPEVAYDEFKACDHLSQVLKQKVCWAALNSKWNFSGVPHTLPVRPTRVSTPWRLW